MVCPSKLQNRRRLTFHHPFGWWEVYVGRGVLNNCICWSLDVVLFCNVVETQVTIVVMVLIQGMHNVSQTMPISGMC